MANKNYFLNSLFFSIFFVAMGCSNKVSIKGQPADSDYMEFEKYTEYVEGEGYCVVKYDKLGCNECLLLYLDDSWSWVCSSVNCSENQEKAHQCIGYRSKEDMMKEAR